MGNLRSADFKSPTTSEFAVTSTLLTQFHVQSTSYGVKQLESPYVTLSECPEGDHIVRRNCLSRGKNHCEPQIISDLSLLTFPVSNKLSTGNSDDDKTLLSKLGDTLKTMAMSSSTWKGLFTAAGGPTSKSLIEQVFDFSITEEDVILAEMMLQVGADPNQKIWDRDLGRCISALDFAARSQSDGIINLLLNSGAVCTQLALKYVILAEDFNTTDRLLQSDPSLDLNFNYLDDLDPDTISHLGHLKLETATLLGLVCLHTSVSFYCNCDERILWVTRSHMDGCRMKRGIASLRYLLRRGAEITLDTMILASFSVDVVTLQVLWKHSGNVCGFNRFGFSCLAAASLRVELQYEVFDLLLCLGATIDISQSHCAFGSQASPFHYLCLRQRKTIDRDKRQLSGIFDLLIESDFSINHRIRHRGSTSELDESFEKFLWSQHSQCSTTMDRIAQATAQSPLEYGIIAGNEGIALELIRRGCQFTDREIKLAVKFGLLSLLKEFSKYIRWDSDKGSIGGTCLRLALRWGHESIVQFLLGDGVKFGEHDVIDAMQYPGLSALSAEVQIGLIRATPDLDQRQIFEFPLLELCCLKFSGAALKEVLRRYVAVYDSGALSATVLRALKPDPAREYGFNFTDIMAIVSRRTESNCDWDKENTALLIAAMFGRPEILRIIVTPQTDCAMKTARLPKEVLSWILDQRYGDNPFHQMDPTYFLGCQDWVACSPLMGIATKSNSMVEQFLSEEMLDHLLACSYEPDALTVVVAATRGKALLLRRLRRLENWRTIVNIDNQDRPSWCPTALQAAVSGESEEVVDLLLDAGVSVNELPAKEPIGHLLPRTALQAAIDKGNVRLTNLLIERGACINAPAAQESGATALQLACIHGYLEITRRLLELGADVNASGALRHGRTALEGAAEHGRIDTIQLLLNFGAYTNLDEPVGVQYLKAILYAEKNRHFAAAALLREHREWKVEDKECYRSLQSYEWCDEW